MKIELHLTPEQADTIIRALSAYKRELQSELDAESVKAENTLRTESFFACARHCIRADKLSDDILTLDSVNYVINCALDAR